ncbi:glycosyltransferase family 4 protein [Paraburkholderia gardini]|uniref:D-inositol-3-phosphate glycosyltransferase n=1 Tax=Paraburkholderia gardini TaxID=2823469 RepID=A0ABM8TYH1_9BURK|nr:glycosyltransferase family 4 protein [Paraburkholderia gardini]CAG4888371.1 D-inositol-3-phosphate glycosyltransferase [Paraburkholderia gardini]CAG4891677.1 D-inositol-3-phosphate glycosyltransferase [Paraburkholderia gardini]
MNILLSIHHELDGSTGAPGVTVKLAEALAQRGHRVTTVSFDNIGWARGKLRAILFPWFLFGHVLAHPEYDVLDLSSGDGWVVNLARRLTGWRRHQLTLTRSHGLEHMGHDLFVESCKDGHTAMSWKYPIYGGGYRLWECRRSFKLADVSLVLNEAEREYAETRFGVDAAHIEKIGNGIDECFARVARHLIAGTSATAGPVNVAFAGRAVFWKGFTYLTEAMTNVLTRYPHVNLGLFGTGSTEAEVLAAFPEAVRARITVVPRYDNKELPALLGGYQVFAFPSLTEGFGMAPLEAMACGLVPVISDIPGPREYMRDGVNGIVVPPRDANALEMAIAGVIDDRERWLALRRGALATAVNYSWTDLAARFELLYCQRRQRRMPVRA